MAFVNEYVPENDKSNQLFSKKDPFPPRHDQLRPYMWTIDREKDFIFKSTGLDYPELPDRFVFQWKGELGAVMADKVIIQEASSSTKEGFVHDVTWTLRFLYLPVVYGHEREAIRQLLTEAFEAYGCFYGQGPTRSVRVLWERCAIAIGGGGYVSL